jgi:hypothetical protein
MKQIARGLCIRISLLLCFLVGGKASLKAADLANAPSEDLLKVYTKLRVLRARDQGAVAENVVWKRDAGTFTFKDGRLAFAAPVEGRVLAAAFMGDGTFELNPPTAIDRHQVERFTKGEKLSDSFKEAVFFFTDNSFDELQKLVNIRPGVDAQAAGNLLESAQKKYEEEFNGWWENAAKGHPVMRNLAARMLADLTDPSSRGFFLADLKTEHHDELLYHISWNRDTLLLPFFANDEEVMLVHYKHSEYHEWWSGFHQAEEYAQNPRPEHRRLLAHCRQEYIEADISKDNHLSVVSTMEFEVSGGPLRVLPLSLAGVLRINSVLGAAGEKLSFIQEDRKLDSDPWIIFPEPAASGRPYTMKIAYEEQSTHETRIVHQQGSGLYYVVERESWFPSFGAFDDRGQYFLHFHSPKKYTFVATGQRVKSVKEGDSVESNWESETPYSVVGFNYGDFVESSQSDGRLTVTAYSGREVPDILKGLQSAMEMRDFTSGRAGGGSEAQTGIMTGGFNTAANVKFAAAQSFQAMKLFEFYFGELPFKSISVTEQPVMGYGQSWPTLIYLPFDSLLDSTTRHSLRLQDSAEGREFYNVVAVHEMSHQWWGHLVGWKTYHDQWLSEGFAHFSAALYLKQFDPKQFREFWDLRRKWLLSNDQTGHRPVDVGPLWLNYQTNSYPEPRTSARLIYDKGSYVLEMLRTLMEAPKQKNPDAPFIAMMRDYASTYAGKNASTEEFRRIVEKHSGEPMEWFFNQWVYGMEVPHYGFSYQLKDAGGGKTVLQFALTQSGVSDSFFMKMPIYAYVNGGPRRLGFITVKGPTTSKGEVPLPFSPEKITADENHSILCTMKQ